MSKKNKNQSKQFQSKDSLSSLSGQSHSSQRSLDSNSQVEIDSGYSQKKSSSRQ